MSDDGMKMTYSAVLKDKTGKSFIRVDFERKNGSVIEVAEGVLPDAKIVRQNGYSKEEIASLEEYLKEKSKDIIAKAKVISNPLKWL